MDPLPVPPYQLQPLIKNITASPDVQYLAGSEVYIGCSNGEILRFALQADHPAKLEAYTLLSRQMVPTRKAIDEIVLVPRVGRAFVLTDQQLHFYALPALDPTGITPLTRVLCFAVDNDHLSNANQKVGGSETVNFCIIRKTGISLCSMKERIQYTARQIPLPSHIQGITLARRSGHSLCVADRSNYNIIDLEAASCLPILPVDQTRGMDGSESSPVIKPSITVISPGEFLLLSWTGSNTLGLFITSQGDPVRGTLEWPIHPKAVCLDYPYITTLLPNETIEIHDVESQAIVQILGAPVSPITRSQPDLPPRSSPLHRRTLSSAVQNKTTPSQGDDPSTSARPQSLPPQSHMPPSISLPAISSSNWAISDRGHQDSRAGIVASLGGYLVPSKERETRMRKVKVRLLRQPPVGTAEDSNRDIGDAVTVAVKPPELSGGGSKDA